MTDLTNTLFLEINAETLYDKGLITDANKTQLEIAFQKNRQKRKDGYMNLSPDEDTKYRKMIKQWLNDQLELFKNIAPLINERRLQPVSIENKPWGHPTEEPQTANLSKLSHLLRLYYEKGCVPLNKNQVEVLAKNTGITAVTLNNRWKLLKQSGYKHNGFIQNIKEFLKTYEYLLGAFKDHNPTAYKNVKNDYDQLNETYPDLTY